MKHQAKSEITVVELVSTYAAKIKEVPFLTLALRLDPQNPGVVEHLALTVDQFHRLRDDLNNMADQHNWLTEGREPPEDLFPYFEAIALEHKPVTDL